MASRTASRKLTQDPADHYHYAYEAHSSVHDCLVTHQCDVTIGPDRRPGGRIIAFDTAGVRDLWVSHGPTVLHNSHGYPKHYRARSPLTPAEAKILMRNGATTALPHSANEQDNHTEPDNRPTTHE